MAKNNGPRISVNKLAECMGAKAQRKRQILRDQKYPEDFKGMYYREATEAVSQCLASGLADTSILSKTIKVLEQVVSDKTGTIRRLNSNIDAIETFESMLDAVDLKGGDPELGEHRPDKLVFHGVEVSVRPDIVLRGKTKGKPSAGALKVHFSKTFALDSASAGYVSAVLQRFAEDKLLEGNEIVGTDFCFVIDVGSKKVYPAVKSITARLKDVAAECQNIAALWPTIAPDE